MLAGIDGCKGGWLSVTGVLNNDGTLLVLKSEIHENWAAAAAEAEIIAVDMPIGLADKGRRGCDGLARKSLGPMRSSVFAAPRRPMLQFDSYAEANAWGKAQGSVKECGGGLSKQAWNITNKIKEIDAWIDADKQSFVKEAHPELAFLRLARGRRLARKKTREGIQQRVALLQDAGFPNFEQPISSLPRTQASVDDLLDASVLLLTAQRIATKEALRLSEDGLRDARDLAMEIWY
jgi:predicted RNase H-like nuclease